MSDFKYFVCMAILAVLFLAALALIVLAPAIVWTMHHPPS